MTLQSDPHNQETHNREEAHNQEAHNQEAHNQEAHNQEAQKTASPVVGRDVQGFGVAGPGVLLLGVLVLSAVASLVMLCVQAVHWNSEIRDKHLGFWLASAILLPFIAGAIVLIGSTLLAVTSLARGKRDPAVAVMRAMRLAFYVSALSTLAFVATWPSQATGYPVWVSLAVILTLLPVLASFYFGKSANIRGRFGRDFGQRMGEAAMKMVARDSAIVVLLMLISLLSVLSVFSMPTIKAFGWHFIVGREWRPNTLEQPIRDKKGELVYDDDGNQVSQQIPPEFGALPVIWGTMISSVIALLFAVPLSFGAAIFLVRIAGRWLVVPVSFLIEFLAAIPSIAYGIWGLLVMCPFLQRIEPSVNRFFLATPGLHWLASPSGGVTGRDMLAGGLILGVMVVPIITAISRDVLKNVPRAQLEGSVALGATWWESSKEMLKYSRAGLFGAVMLGLARAAGETMAITMVIGNNNQIRTSLFAPAQTMSSLLANEFAEAGEELQRSALTEVALILLVMSLLFNIVARYLVVGKNSRSAASV